MTTTAVGEWLEYTVNVLKSGSQGLSIRYASTVASKVHFEVGGVNVSGTINLAATAGVTTFQTVSSSMTLAAGVQVIRFVVDLGTPNLNNFTLSSTTGMDNISNNAMEPVVNLYPNPASNMITLEFSSLLLQNINCDFIDNSGKVMKSVELKANEGASTFKIDVSNLRHGTYLLKIKAANQQMTKTFVKI